MMRGLRQSDRRTKYDVKLFGGCESLIKLSGYDIGGDTLYPISHLKIVDNTLIPCDKSLRNIIKFKSKFT